MVTLKMPDINNVTIAGNLTNEPSFRKTTNGTPVANFYIASNRKFKDNSGQWRENVCFIGVVAWHKLAESCCEFLTKGSAVLVEGELQSRSWKNEDGSNNNVVEIKARRIQFLNRQSKREETLGSDENGESHLNEIESKDTADLMFENNAAETASEGSHSATDESNTEQSIPSHSRFNFGYEDSNL